MNYDAAIRQTADGHPIDALIAAYAAKTLSAPLAALVAAHLELKPDNRAYAAALEAVHGVFLEEVRPVPLAGRDRRLVNIFASPEPSRQPAEPASLAGGGKGILPRALRRLAGCDDAHLRWRSRASGVKEALPPGTDGSARFISAQPGKRVPMASEEGLTTALVLAGCAGDGSRQYRRGDIIVVADEADDQPIAEGDGDCICFVVGESPAKPLGPFRRVLRRITGR